MNSDTESGMVLRTGTVADAAAAAALHAGQISEGFLSILGPRFLTKLYRRVARTPGSFLLRRPGWNGNGRISRRLHRCQRPLPVLRPARRCLRCGGVRRPDFSLLAAGPGDSSPRRERGCRRRGVAGRCRRSERPRTWCGNPPGERLPPRAGAAEAGRGTRRGGSRQRDRDRPVHTGRIRDCGEVRAAPGD